MSVKRALAVLQTVKWQLSYQSRKGKSTHQLNYSKLADQLPNSQGPNERPTCFLTSRCLILLAGFSNNLRWFASYQNSAAEQTHEINTSPSITAALLDGRSAAYQWEQDLARQVGQIKHQSGRPPGLGVVLVGHRRDSLIYVARKQEACARLGIRTDIRHLPVDISQSDIQRLVADMCEDTSLDGVLVQLPLPPHIREEPLVDSIAPGKDVDGFHPLNMGRTLMRGRRATFVPCTALGVMQLLYRSNVQLTGRNVVILGDSNIVGMPLAMLFRDGGAATVTVVHRTSYGELFADAASEERAAQRAEAGACHPRLPGFLSGHAVGEEKGSNTSSATTSPTSPHPPAAAAAAAEPYEVTYSANLRDAYRWKQRDVYSTSSSSNSNTSGRGPDLPAITSTADILVVAVGYPGLVKRGWVKPGAVVVDVGINVVDWENSDSIDGGSGGRGKGGIHQVRHDLAGVKKSVDDSDDDGLFHVVGDVDFEDVGGIAAAITPVPGGVGPMTVAALMHNTVEAAKENLGIKVD